MHTSSAFTAASKCSELAALLANCSEGTAGRPGGISSGKEKEGLKIYLDPREGSMSYGTPQVSAQVTRRSHLTAGVQLEGSTGDSFIGRAEIVHARTVGLGTLILAAAKPRDKTG